MKTVRNKKRIFKFDVGYLTPQEVKEFMNKAIEQLKTTNIKNENDKK